MDFTRGKVQHFWKAEVYKFLHAQHVDWGWTRISWSSVTSKKKAYCLNFRGRTYRLANPQIPTFTQPHAASINTGDTNNASILWKVPHTVLLVLSWFSNRRGKRAKRTKLDFRCPISRSAIGQASCLRAPSSNNVPVLLLNQPTVRGLAVVYSKMTVLPLIIKPVLWFMRKSLIIWNF